MNSWLAVISDLHVSNAALDDFDAEIEQSLIRFLDSLGGRPEGAELVINGDFLDFVQASPHSGPALESQTAEGIPLCFSEAQSVEKLAAIQAAHPAIFDALNRFLVRSEANRIVILPGNHDPDLFWPEIQNKLMTAICRNADVSRLRIHYERAYRPPDYPWLWIEHGHQHDPVNAFFLGGEERWSASHPPIFVGADGTPRLYECTGTRFLIRYLNGLDEKYPYVDNVKPFGRFLKIFGASALVPGWSTLDATIAVTKILGFLTGTAITRPGDLLGVTAEDGTSPPHALAAWVEEASDAARTRLADRIRTQGFDLPFPLQMLIDRPGDLARLVDFLADHPALLEGLGEKPASLLGAGRGTLTLKAGFSADETNDLYQGAKRVAGNGVSTVVMGHTHEPIEKRGSFTYFNTGSWTRYYRFGEDEKTRPWRILRERSYETFPFSLRHALVRPGATTATVETWEERTRA